jgi:Holliday junction resolvase RusA-like endonuclease
MPKRGKWPVLTSDNPNLKSFRQEVSKAAMVERARRLWPMPDSERVIFRKHEPVSLTLTFCFNRPPSIPKKRQGHVVKPDLSKLIRATEDALTGILFADDSQVVQVSARKTYSQPECVVIYLKSGEIL